MLDINVKNVSKKYNLDYVLKDISFNIYTGDKVAIIGDNGCGKSTLLNIICGVEKETSGIVSIRNDIKIGYLPQMANYDTDDTVKELLYESFNKIIEIRDKLSEYEKKMNDVTGTELDKLINKYSNLQEKYIIIGGCEIDKKVSKMVAKFKLGNMLDSNFNVLSGGEKRIVMLAKLMLSDPDLLILDEPTNHLDIDTLEWFENYLNNYKGTIIVVSHDRYFIDRFVNKVLLIENGKNEIFNGNYSYYLVENEQRIFREFNEYKDQQKMILAMKNKIKKLKEFGRLASPLGENFFRRANSIQKRLDKIELLAKPKDKVNIPIEFAVNSRAGNVVLTVKEYSKGFKNKELFSDCAFRINYLDKVCLIGKNGTGKSTLINDIVSNYYDNVDSNIIFGRNIKLGYIPQEIHFDNPNETVYEYARKCFNGFDSNLRASLDKFLFIGNNIFKILKDLSGGEKVRIKLFELMQLNANFIILDEPTNHIDIATRELLEEALSDYSGTLLFVSHDRYFINKLANKTIYINNKKIIEYIGNYDDYKNYLKKNLHV